MFFLIINPNLSAHDFESTTDDLKPIQASKDTHPFHNNIFAIKPNMHCGLGGG